MEADYIEQMKHRFDHAWTERTVWFHRWDEAFELVVPARAERYRTSPGGSVAPYIYDTTAAESAENLANQMVSALTPAGTPWMILTPGTDFTDHDERLEMMQMLEPVNRILVHHLHKSHFSLAVQPAFLDMMVTAGALKIEPDTDKKTVRVECIPIDQLAYLQSKDGSIDHLYRKYKVRAHILLEKYEDKFDEETLKDLRNNTTSEHDIEMSLEPHGKKYRYVERFMGKRDDIVLVDRLLEQNPYVVWRWSTTANTPYGRGLALIKFHDILNLNTFKEYQLQAAAFDLLGVWGVTDDGVLNPYTLNMYPGAKIPMASVSMQDPSMRRLDEQSAGRYSIGENTLNQLQDTIRSAFFADKFSPIEGDKMSATEILRRAKDLSQTLGATYGRIEAELLRPSAEKYLKILKAQGAFKELDKDVQDNLVLDGRILDVRFLGTLAQAQELQHVQSLFQFLSLQAQLAPQDPEVQILVDHVGALIRTATALGIDPRLLRNKEERSKIYEEAQRQTGAVNGGQPAGASQAAPGGAGEVLS